MCSLFITSGKTECKSPPPITSSVLLCLFVSAETCVNSVATVLFPSVYNFSLSYPWKTCSVTSSFARISLSATPYLPIRFLETPTCHSNLRLFIQAYLVLKFAFISDHPRFFWWLHIHHSTRLTEEVMSLIPT
jgi:hypothetical protein